MDTVVELQVLTFWVDLTGQAAFPGPLDYRVQV
jgi:hypothetical protein